jgi:hypothetical protein
VELFEQTFRLVFGLLLGVVVIGGNTGMFLMRQDDPKFFVALLH